MNNSQMNNCITQASKQQHKQHFDVYTYFFDQNKRFAKSYTDKKDNLFYINIRLVLCNEKTHKNIT